MKDFPALIRTARERRGLKTHELAARLRRPSSFVSRLETGIYKETPQPEVLRALEAALGLPVAVQLEALGYDCGVPETAITDPLLVDLVQSWPLSPGATHMIGYLIENERAQATRFRDDSVLLTALTG